MLTDDNILSKYILAFFSAKLISCFTSQLARRDLILYSFIYANISVISFDYPACFSPLPPA